jgi:hypothetical protein
LESRTGNCNRKLRGKEGIYQQAKNSSHLRELCNHGCSLPFKVVEIIFVSLEDAEEGWTGVSRNKPTLYPLKIGN